MITYEQALKQLAEEGHQVAKDALRDGVKFEGLTLRGTEKPSATANQRTFSYHFAESPNVRVEIDAPAHATIEVCGMHAIAQLTRAHMTKNDQPELRLVK